MSPAREYTRPTVNGLSDSKRPSPDSLHAKLVLEARVDRLAEKFDALVERFDRLSENLLAEAQDD
jgi:hypothetical protein